MILMGAGRSSAWKSVWEERAMGLGDHLSVQYGLFIAFYYERGMATVFTMAFYL